MWPSSRLQGTNTDPGVHIRHEGCFFHQTRHEIKSRGVYNPLTSVRVNRQHPIRQGPKRHFNTLGMRVWQCAMNACPSSSSARGRKRVRNSGWSDSSFRLKCSGGMPRSGEAVSRRKNEAMAGMDSAGGRSEKSEGTEAEVFSRDFKYYVHPVLLRLQKRMNQTERVTNL